MTKRLRTTAILTSLLLLTASSSFAQLPAATRACANQIMLRSRNYVRDVGNLVRATVNANLTPTDRFCGTGSRKCGGLGAPCTSSATCGGVGCYPNLGTGSGVSRRICQYQEDFHNGVENLCTAGDIALLDFPSTLCPAATDPFDVVECILENNASYREGGIIVDTTYEPMRRASTQIDVPHPGGTGPYPSYPTDICGVPGSYLMDFGTQSNDPIIGIEGGFRPLYTDGCVGSVCDTKGDSTTTFAGNLIEPPRQVFAGVIPICLLMRPVDTGNTTSEDGTIDLATGEQHSFEPMEIVVLIGTTCPMCDPLVAVCDSGPAAGQPCADCGGGTSYACPPTIAGSPSTIPLPFQLTTETATLNIPAHNPGGGVTNPVQAFCGSCDLDDVVGCQNDTDCIAAGACSGSVGSGCCDFGSSPGFAGDPSVTSLSVSGARGPFIPHLAGVGCGGKSGSALVDVSAGFPAPWRYIEPRLNVYAW